jgi:hypothetical protein
VICGCTAHYVPLTPLAVTFEDVDGNLVDIDERCRCGRRLRDVQTAFEQAAVRCFGRPAPLAGGLTISEAGHREAA